MLQSDGRGNMCQKKGDVKADDPSNKKLLGADGGAPRKGRMVVKKKANLIKGKPSHGSARPQPPGPRPFHSLAPI